VAKDNAYTSGRDLGSVSENVELLTGQRGDRLDKAVTYRELQSLGLATLARVGKSYQARAADSASEPVSSNVIDFPGQPHDLQASGAFNIVLLTWSEPDYRGHAYTEIWRAETDNQAVAVRIGTSGATLYADPIGSQAKAYYWIRFVNSAGAVGPFSGEHGVYAETAIDVQSLLDALDGQIVESALSDSLRSSIARIEGIAGSMQTMIEQISMTAVAAASSALTGDEGVRTARSTQAAIRSELRAVADDQHAVIDSVTTLEATAGDLTAQVEEHSRSISTLEDGAQALWSVKTQVGDIKAGIGLLVNSYGQSQVMISASQMFVFDPNSNAPTQALFAISNGAVAIRKAIIEQATIETVTAMSITADFVKAGVSLNAPVINGGSLLIGSGDNSLQAEGGSLAVGKGGGYSQFGANWHTVIYADGSIYTDRLNAASGTFTGTVNANAGTFNNVTINENCRVLGSIYANRIVGDVYAKRYYNVNIGGLTSYGGNVIFTGPDNGVRVAGNGNISLLNINVNAFSKTRYLKFTGIGALSSGSSANCRVEVYINGSSVWHTDIAAGVCGGGEGDKVLFSLPANTSVNVNLVIWGLSYTTYLHGCVDSVEIFPVDSGTFA
jgi:hypothetical protein